jgi:hypothetical protein
LGPQEWLALRNANAVCLRYDTRFECSGEKDDSMGDPGNEDEDMLYLGDQDMEDGEKIVNESDQEEVRWGSHGKSVTTEQVSTQWRLQKFHYHPVF